MSDSRRTLLVFASLAVLWPGPRPLAAADKPETWSEVKSPHFTVITNAGEKQGRKIAEQFELIRSVIKSILPKARLDSGKPILIFAVKSEKDLKKLLPAYWEGKDPKRLAGMFAAGEEKSYVALRMDTNWEDPYHVVFHEYLHSLTQLNIERLPLWVDEGLAEFFAHTQVMGKEVGLGRPNWQYTEMLTRTSLIPWEVFFAVDHTSPHYKQGDKSSIFYAQAWALAHHLQVDPEARKSGPLSLYLRLVDGGMDQVAAAGEAFGDFKKLQRKMESYVRQESLHYVKLPAPADIDERTFAARMLAPAEATALRGDFYMHTNRPDEAASALNEAFRLDPNLPLVHEALGFLHFRQGRRQDAARELAEAARLNSSSFLTHYWLAMLTSQDSGREGAFDEAEQHLRRTIELNREFAGAYSMLATFLVRRNDKARMDEALALAGKAVELEPGTLVFHLNMGQVLLRLERAAEARQIGQRVLQAARTESDRQNATNFLSTVQGFEEFLARRKKHEEGAREAEARREEFRKKLEEQRRREEAEAAAAPPPAAPVKKGRSAPPPKARYSASTGSNASIEGRISELTCTDPALMELTLSIGGYNLKLRAKNFYKVEYLSSGDWTPPADFKPCEHLKGKLVLATYTTLLNQSYAGEIISIEVKR